MTNTKQKVATIRTTDRSIFRACRRKWHWSSHLRENLRQKQNAAPLWFGSGFHYAMEDYYGERKFKKPSEAFIAYMKATKLSNPNGIPEDYSALTEMAIAMLDYFLLWEERRKHSLLPTYIHNGKPQLEVNFRIDIPLPQHVLDKSIYDKAVYSGTIDRVVIDEDIEMLWLLDYKTAKRFETGHLIMDSQITSYCWAASQMYDLPVAGMIYAQHLKKDITLPKPLKSGKLSVAQNQITSSVLYKQALIDLNGSLEKSTPDNINYLNNLAKQEDERQDPFIRYDYVERNRNMQMAEGAKILLECEDMLNPDLPLYPSPSRDCANFCQFKSACVSFDDGSDWEYELEQLFEKGNKEYDPWRKYIDQIIEEDNTVNTTTP